MNPVGHPVERSNRQLCKQIWGSTAMSGVDTQVWELEVYKSSLQSAAVHAGDFTEGDKQSAKDRSLENTCFSWQAQEEPSKVLKLSL